MALAAEEPSTETVVMAKEALTALGYEGFTNPNSPRRPAQVSGFSTNPTAQR